MNRKTDVHFKVVVIGGGIGGLAVAHAIENARRNGQLANVEVKVYERREDESSFQRYPIHIAPDGRSALSSILSPSELETLLRRSAHGVSNGGITLFTPTWGKLFGVRRYEGESPQFVHRWVLKEVLEEGVNVVRRKRCVGVEETGEGKVKVKFDDGSQEVVDLVIGADGLGSTIRSTLYPSHARFALLPYLVVQMKLAFDAADKLPVDLHGINMVLGRQSYSVLLVPFHGSRLPPLPPDTEDAPAHPTTGRGSFSAAVQDVHKALDQDTPEYIFLNTTLPAFTQWEDMVPEALVQRIVGLLEKDGASPALIKMLQRDVVPGTVGAWQIVSSDEKDPVPFGGGGGRVVLIGDAAHAMPPQGGVGGSTALKDAQLLVETLISSTELSGTDGPLSELLPRYHNEMITRSHGHMKDAKRRLYLSNRSGWRVYTRNALLRVMNFFWPLANWVLNRGRESAKRANAEVKRNKST